MNKGSFVHLHNHTEYSLLDGACRVANDKGEPSDLLKYVAAHNMPAFAITDHGNMFGAIEFYGACKNVGIKPIIGCEMYLTSGSRFDKQAAKTPGQEKNGRETHKNFHMVLLAKDHTGYENLMRLVSSGYLEGFYYKPRIDKEILQKHTKGLVCLSGCLNGEVSAAVHAGDDKRAVTLAQEYKSMFGEDFYLELMDNGMPEQQAIIPKLLELSRKTNIPVVATNDCHYFRKEDAFAHDVLLCIGTSKTIDDPKRLKFPNDQFYVKSPEEMTKIFSDVPEAIKNTLLIAEKCNLTLSFDQLLLPHFEVPGGEKPEAYLRKLCEEGLKKRFTEITPEINARLDFELSTINKMGFASYFLIVQDFVHYAKNNGVPVGPGRGSGAGAIVAYALGITNISPLKYGLLFERFLNPDRRTMPDLDIDFADYGRDKVIDYVRKKYGEKNVAQIITFGTMQSRLAIRDVARALGMPIADGDKVAKLIPMGSSIYKAVEGVKELKDLEKIEKFKKLIDMARQLEGLKRHQGVHAAGIVIAKDDITKYTPLSKSTRKVFGEQEIITTQYNDESLIKLGMLKMDFLGLRTLTVIEEAIRLIKLKANKNFDLESIPLDDQKTFELLQKAKTNGVFQLESSSIQDLLRKLKPTVFEDIIAVNALHRPGPMGSGMLDEFVSRKHKTTKIKFEHPLLEPILRDTYGIIVYQEQVMQITRALAGFTAGQADVIRKAMGKKIPEEIAKQRESFVEGAKKNNIDKRLAEKIFDMIDKFGGYGFNKSHAAAYGLVSYQTAYLKANYAIEYTCALLSSEIGRSTVSKEEGTRLTIYIKEAKDNNIEILPPDVQRSDTKFSIENNKIRFALLAIKNVGEQAAKDIISCRRKDGPFKSLPDFFSRVDGRQVNKKVVESLIKAGALDSLGLKEEVSLPAYVRAKAMSILESSGALRDKEETKQAVLFETTPEENKNEKVEPWHDHIVLNNEREVLGFYFSGHPLGKFRETINQVSTCKINELPAENSQPCRVAGMISNVWRLSTKATGEQMAKFRLENFDGEVDVLLFPKTFALMNKFLALQALVVVKGKVNTRDETPTIIADELSSLEEYRNQIEKQAKKLTIRFTSAGTEGEFLNKLKSYIHGSPGHTQVFLEILDHSNKKVLIETQHKVTVSNKLLAEIKNLLGDNCCAVE